MTYNTAGRDVVNGIVTSLVSYLTTLGFTKVVFNDTWPQLVAAAIASQFYGCLQDWCVYFNSIPDNARIELSTHFGADNMPILLSCFFLHEDFVKLIGNSIRESTITHSDGVRSRVESEGHYLYTAERTGKRSLYIKKTDLKAYGNESTIQFGTLVRLNSTNDIIKFVENTEKAFGLGEETYRNVMSNPEQYFREVLMRKEPLPPLLGREDEMIDHYGGEDNCIYSNTVTFLALQTKLVHFDRKRNLFIPIGVDEYIKWYTEERPPCASFEPYVRRGHTVRGEINRATWGVGLALALLGAGTGALGGFLGHKITESMANSSKGKKDLAKTRRSRQSRRRRISSRRGVSQRRRKRHG